MPFHRRRFRSLAQGWRKQSKNNNPTVRIMCTIPAEQFEILQRIAALNETPVAALIRVAVRDYLTGYARQV